MYKRNKLALSVSAAVLSGGLMVPLATAQPDEALEEITVVGIRGALQSALNTKRDANAVVDAISAEDIGKFPDKNIAESLQRVSGVSINRGFTGEGNEVSIRGTNPELTQVLLNGQFVASTGWFSQQANKRSFNMDLMPSEMVSSVEVYKSPVASQDEGGVGGTVVVNTRKPLELDPLTVYASSEMMTNTIDDEDVGLGLSSLASWKNDAETFGVLAAVSRVETIGRAHKGENYWEEGWAGAGIAEFNQDRVREAFDITAQFRPSDSLELGLHYFATEIDAENTNQNFLVIPNPDSVITAASGSRTTPGGYPTIGTATDNFWLVQDTNSRNAVMDSEVVSFTGDFQGDSYTVHGALGMTQANGGNGGNYNGGWGTNALAAEGITIDYNFDGTSGMMIAPQGVDPADPSWQKFVWGGVNSLDLTDEETYGQVDLGFDVEWGAISRFKTGLKIRQHAFTTSSYSRDADLSGIDSLEDFADGTIKHSGEGLFGSFTSFVRLDADAYKAYVDENSTATDNGLNFFNGFDRAAWGEVEEDITALYVQADFEGESYRGNVGVRYVGTDVTGTRHRFHPETRMIDDEEVTVAVYEEGKESLRADYSDWLPSMNLAIDISEDVIMRMSAARVMSRPGYSQLTPVISISSIVTQQANSGNIEIDPFRATQTDIGLEWYFSEEALASVTVFSKDIQSFVVQSTVPMEINGSTWQVGVPTQGRGGKLQGLELQYQQNFNEFGVVANYTYVEGEGEDASGNSIDLPGTSKNSYNLTGYYENNFLSARLAYTYRDEFLAEGLGIGGSSVFADQAFLDGSLTWHVLENLDISLEGVNLLGEVTRELHGDGLGTLRVSNDNGTRYFLKASYRL
ncbi:TonB-dependent receptor [Microbulbifer sp. TYP-18]|uniref:TonB-dependent receptor n=1 Tax=Microbulbifer sp. TYP-18 TaxID=3230024 RepID=UPI0034C6A720